MIGVFVQLNTDSKYAECKPIGYVITERGCWDWVGATQKGYGCYRRDGQLLRAHRMLYEEDHGAIPRGMHLHHRCHNRRCVNPAHLEPVAAQVHPFRHVNFAIENVTKRQCPAGHPYDPTNKYDTSGRRCRECGRRAQREYNRRRRRRDPSYR